MYCSFENIMRHDFLSQLEGRLNEPDDSSDEFPEHRMRSQRLEYDRMRIVPRRD